MEIPGARLSAQTGKPLNVDACDQYIILKLEFAGLLLSSIFQKIYWKFYFEDLTDKLFVEWRFKTKLYPLESYL